jgi:hypothetical protein
MKKSTLAALALTVAVIGLVSCASDKKTSTPSSAPLTYADSASVAMNARVEAIDYTTRRITLRDTSGHSARYVVGPQVQRLNEVKVGDYVTANYSVSLQAELRPPTAEEAANPIMITEGLNRSPQGTDPAASAGRRVRVVTTVQAVDLGKMLVTLRGPMGDTTSVRARKAENIQKLHVGDTIVISYVESATIFLVK